MTNKEQIEELKEQIADIQERLNELEKEELSNNEKYRWLKNGAAYWFINYLAKLSSDDFCGDEIDKGRKSIGNIFRTNEECEFEIERLKVIEEMKQFSKKFVKGEYNLYFYYDYDNDYLDTDYDKLCKRNDIYFDANGIKKCKEAVGEDRIKKYYLKVED